MTPFPCSIWEKIVKEYSSKVAEGVSSYGMRNENVLLPRMRLGGMRSES